MRKAQVTGFVAPGFEDVRIQMEKNIAEGLDIGAGFAAYYKGELVVDIFGGIANLETKKPYTQDTLQMVYSSSKALSGIIIARLVDQGLLNYDAPISDYWPEFSQGNKQDVLLKDLLCHRAGVSWLDAELSPKLVGDLDKFSKVLAEQSHNFGGKAVRAYHGTTRGWYLNEIVRRVDPKKRTIGDIVREEINPTYGVEFYYSFKDKEFDELNSRVAGMYNPPTLQVLSLLYLPNYLNKRFGFGRIEPGFKKFTSRMMDKKSGPNKALVKTSPLPGTLSSKWNSPALRKIESPSFSGMTNARTLARLASIMSNRGSDPTSNPTPLLLSQKVYDLAMTTYLTEFDTNLGFEVTMTNGGWALFDNVEGMDGEGFVGWCGAGGSCFLWSEKRNVGYGYVMNKMALESIANKPGKLLMRTLMNCIDKLEGKGE